MSAANVLARSTPTPEEAIFVGERTTFDRFPIGCRLFVVFVIYGSIICCPKQTRKLKDYANKRWNWTDIQGRSIVYTVEEANRMCAGNPLMFKIKEPIGKLLPPETVLYGEFGFPANPDAYHYGPSTVEVKVDDVKQLAAANRSLSRVLPDREAS